jgi:hypothetical protein
MKKHKVLNPDLRSPYQDFKYKIGKKYVCKNFDEDPKKDCSYGFYATDIEGLLYSFNINKKIFEVEVGGKSVIYNQFKQRFEKQTIIRECSFDEIKVLALQEEEKLGYKLSEALFPFHPFHVEGKLNRSKHIELLKQWASVGASVWDSVGASVGASVRDSVWASVGDSVGASVGASVWDSVWASVGDSVRDSVWASVGDSVGASVGASVRDSVWASVWASVGASVGAYMSGLFPNIQDWKYIKHENGKNPFQPCINLWKDGLVPSFDGKVWWLHNKNGIVWKGEL